MTTFLHGSNEPIDSDTSLVPLLAGDSPSDPSAVSPPVMKITFAELWQAHVNASNGNNIGKKAATTLNGEETAFSHFLECLGKNLNDFITDEFGDAYNAYRERYEKELLEIRGNSPHTIKEKCSRVCQVRATWTNLEKTCGLPADFHRAFLAAVKRSGYGLGQLSRIAIEKNPCLVYATAGKFNRVHSAYKNWANIGNWPSARTLDILITTEQILDVPGALFARLPHLDSIRKHLWERDPSDHLPASLGPCIRELRKRAGLSVDNLCAQLGVDQKVRTLIYGWETEPDRHPGINHQPLMERLDVMLQAEGSILRRFNIRETHYVGGHGGIRHDPNETPSAIWNSALDVEFAQLNIFKSKALVPKGYSRMGRWDSDETANSCRNEFSYFFGWLFKIKGWTGEFTIALVTDYNLIEEYVHWREQRNTSYNNWSINFPSLIRSLVRPETGYFWQYPETILSSPYLRDKLPTTEQSRRRTKSLIKLELPEDQSMVWCESCHKDLYILITNIKGLIGTKHFKETRPSCARIESILEMDNPIDAMIICSKRMKEQRPPLSWGSEWATHIRDELIIALLSVYPYREGTVVNLLEGHFSEGDSGWQARIEAELFKNGRPGLGAEFGWHGRLHKSVAELMSIYVDKARPMLIQGRTACDRFFVSSVAFGRQTVSLKSIFHICISKTKKYIPELAPNGINPHACRKIVASQYINNDLPNGEEFAATALTDKKSTVNKVYAKIHQENKNNRYTDKAESTFSERRSAMKKKEARKNSDI